jgi:hypothetical protein
MLIIRLIIEVLAFLLRRFDDGEPPNWWPPR